MKKLLYLITQSELGGAQRYIVDLAKNLKNEYEISVGFGEQGEKGELDELLKRAGIKYYIIPHLKRPISPLSDLRALFKIIKLIKEIKPQIIHLNSSKISILGSLACWLLKFRVSSFKFQIVYTAHGWVFNEPMARWRKIFYRLAEKYTARLKDKIICINKLDYQVAKNELKIDEKKLSVIYHGLEFGQYKFLPREEARQKLFSQIKSAQAPSQDEIIIGSLGNLYATKGYYYFIKAMHYLIIDYQLPLTAVIIGEGPERKELEKWIKKFHPMDYDPADGRIKNKIILAGRVAEAAELLPAFDFYVSTSLKEGFPYSILEAMAAGLPVIATRVGGIPDMINDGQNGLLIEAKNSKPLAKKIFELYNNPGLREEISQRAKHDAVGRFKFSKMLEETKKVYGNQ